MVACRKLVFILFLCHDDTFINITKPYEFHDSTMGWWISLSRTIRTNKFPIQLRNKRNMG